MRAKTLVELLTLSTNLYMISKDEAFMKNVEEMAKKGKMKLDDFMDDFSETVEDDEETLVQKVMHKANEAKVEFEKKMEELAVTVYKKMNIAHAEDLNNLATKIELLENKIDILESKLETLENKK
jgi:polyhydroxyalkanoate synthesis regulator phasin